MTTRKANHKQYLKDGELFGLVRCVCWLGVDWFGGFAEVKYNENDSVLNKIDNVWGKEKG